MFCYVTGDWSAGNQSATPESATFTQLKQLDPIDSDSPRPHQLSRDTALAAATPRVNANSVYKRENCRVQASDEVAATQLSSSSTAAQMMTSSPVTSVPPAAVTAAVTSPRVAIKGAVLVSPLDDNSCTISAAKTLLNLSLSDHPEAANSDHLETANSDSPETANSDHPKTANSDRPETANSDHPEAANSDHLETANSDHPEATNSEKATVAKHDLCTFYFV